MDIGGKQDKEDFENLKHNRIIIVGLHKYYERESIYRN